MALSTSFSLASTRHVSQLCYCNHKSKRKKLDVVKPDRRNFNKFSWAIKSVLNNRSSSSISDNGAIEPARILLERLFAQTQKLEEQIVRDPRSPEVAELGLNLGKLEEDLHAALLALRKKEEELQDAERKILLEYNDISRARKDLERQEAEITAARWKQDKLEEELRLANLDLASQATEIGNMKMQLKERDEQIAATQSALSAKEEQITYMKNELLKKNEDAAAAESEFRSKIRLFDEANQTVEKQKAEIKQLKRAIQKKDEELGISVNLQKAEAEKLKNTEAKLEKQTMDWLIAQEELKKLADETSKHIAEANATAEDFGRVRKLLSDVRSELVSSQNALASSRHKMLSQDKLLEKQLAELEELRMSVTSYMKSLRDAEVELESERVQLRVAESRIEELERDLSIEKEIVIELQKELDKEKLSLKQAIEEMSAIKKKLDRKSAEFEDKQALLKVKESELVEARLEIQHLKSEQASLQLVIEEKDLELSDAKKRLEELNQEIAALKGMLIDREEELVQMMSNLKKKDQHLQAVQHELTDAKLKFSEAETVVEKIVDLTKEVVLSLNDGSYYTLNPPIDQDNDRTQPMLIDTPPDGFKWQKKQLETELQFMRESLRAKEMEVLAAQKALTIKDQELKMVLEKLDNKEKEITKLKEDMTQDKNDLTKLYALAQERIGEKSVGDLAIEKLQLEAAQLEVEVATSALQKIAEMSRELLNKASISIEADHDIVLLEQSGLEATINERGDDECSGEVKSEVSRLLTLTEQLVAEAGLKADI